MDAIKGGANILIVSDRDVSATQVAIPALLALSAIHQHLVREGLRTTTGLVVETGTAREVHHFAVLAGYGAEAVHPYLAMETLADMHKEPARRPVCRQGHLQLRQGDRQGPVQDHVQDGRVAPTCRYCGAQLFEAIGLNTDTVDKYFTGTASRVEGIGVFEIAEEAIRNHKAAFGDDPVLDTMLDAGGEYAWRARGEDHMWTPDAIAKLQHSHPFQQLQHLQGIRAAHQRPEQAPHDAARPVRVQDRPGHGHPGGRGRARQPRSSSVSPPAPCRWVRSPPKPTPRWPWP